MRRAFIDMLLVVFALITLVVGLRYDPDQVGYNINENVTATDPLDYWGQWPDHEFHASPINWRMPMYTLFIDRFVNGDPTNDDANGTQFEHDILSNQLRYGGDVQGLRDTLDYLQGMRVRTIYIAGSPMLNFAWAGDQYSPLDLTLLDRHLGDIQAWREVISDIHNRGMYVILDNTMATLGDLIGFENYLNISTPFDRDEHNVVWKSERRYHDFHQSDAELDECTYPRFWGDDGYPVNPVNNTPFLTGCRDSEFDQYGEVASFGNYPEWQRQLSKFAFVQDRLREWRPSVMDKLKHFGCMTIASLDIDGFRIDKAVQVSVDAQGEWSRSIRECAQKYNKTNFYIPGEIVTGNSFGAIYVGRGMQPDMQADNLTEVVTTTRNTSRNYLRSLDNSALDGAAFHYTVYRALTRFLGLSGSYQAQGDPPVNFVQTWNTLLQTNDMSNAYTGEFDPRHMFGISNQDVFRWPAIANGTQKNLLGLFIITLLFPGIPTLSWGEEQAFYVLESTNANYVFGRAPMTSSRAWELHGCYAAGSVKYANFPLDQALYGCEDDNISLDHRDPSHPLRNIIKRMLELREQFPVLNDGYYLQQLSNHTHDIFLKGSGTTPTELGLWSIYRAGFDGVQDFSGQGAGNQSVWLLYMNEGQAIDYEFDCSSSTSLVSPFVEGTVVKNLFWPYEEHTLQTGHLTLGLEGTSLPNGCLSNLSMAAWDYKAFVPKASFYESSPVITEFVPGHDFRLVSTIETGDTVHVGFGFSIGMDCNSITNSMSLNSTVGNAPGVRIDTATIKCSSTYMAPSWVGQPATTFWWEADLIEMHHGLHQITINNATSSQGTSTNSIDHFLLRIGTFENPMVFPSTANYSANVLSKNADGQLEVAHNAAGADLWRYSLNFGTTYSDWTTYSDEVSKLAPVNWTGTKLQAWDGDHVILQYWGQLAGSSDHYQHGDLYKSKPSALARRFPNLFLEGQFNEYGFDSGLANEFSHVGNGTWQINIMDEWPSQVSLNAWGINPDGLPDVTRVYGDIDGDHILDRIPPQSLLNNVVNITDVPPSPYLTWLFELNDGTFRYHLVPAGSRWNQLAVYILLAIFPVLTSSSAVWVFIRSFYQIKFNKFGAEQAPSAFTLPLFLRRKKARSLDGESLVEIYDNDKSMKGMMLKMTGISSPRFGLGSAKASIRDSGTSKDRTLVGASSARDSHTIDGDSDTAQRRLVLIATIEYEIEDWAIKVRIGGLGVMASLMGKNLSHQDLIWVIPCVGGVEYPDIPEEHAEPMQVTILDEFYEIGVRIHVLRNITFVLLDAPIFRHQTKAEPYPPRMDDLQSAVYYSAWNSCIAEAIRRFQPDLYHINDYHGAVAPLHLLPDTVPCALSLHNAEFQGMWPMRNKEEREEVCRVYNLDPDIVADYVQFGEVFNLLHAGASYLRIHQKGFGAVGVSKKYGKRSYARYPIFWGLKEIGALPNPDPTDTADWNRQSIKIASHITIDERFEASRGDHRIQAQRWAGLKEDPHAELFVFVGRWSMQKGLDLIADVFPLILEQHPRTQLICVGPLIDLYGKFASIKLAKLMEIYPDRVYSKPEFTALPPFIFTGAEFALIPSRDEPFGLVAVEFGRKGALGVGGRVGGLGQMPGWWYTIESTSAKHLISQFKTAIESALAAPTEMRAELRARSAKQRFPVVEWMQTLEELQTGAIRKHNKYRHWGARFIGLPSIQRNRSGTTTPRTGTQTPRGRSQYLPGTNTTPSSRATSRGSGAAPDSTDAAIIALQKSLARLGSSNGPGHEPLTTDVDVDVNVAVDDDLPPAEQIITQDTGYYLQRHNPNLRRFPQHQPVHTTDEEFWDEYFDERYPGLQDLSQPLPAMYAESTYSLDPALLQFDFGFGKHGFEQDIDSAFQNHDFEQEIDPHFWDMPGHGRIQYVVDDTSSEIALGGSSGAICNCSEADQSERPHLISTQTTDTMQTINTIGQVATGWTPLAPDNGVSPVLLAPRAHFRQQSGLSLSAVTKSGSKRSTGLLLLQTDPFFTDVKHDYQRVFEKKLTRLNAKNTYETCINEFIEKAEKDWFNRLRGLKLGKLDDSSRMGIEPKSSSKVPASTSRDVSMPDEETENQFSLETNYKPPSGLKLFMLRRIGDWPFYSILVAFGQIIAANSYQITLITGEVGESASKLYVIASIYLATSIIWWVIYRCFKPIYILSMPFVFYGLAFFFIGMAAIAPSPDGKKWIQNMATAFYATASSSGSFFFALNFGDGGGAPVTAWVFRACVIQGTQQIYVAALWWWGSNLTKLSVNGQQNTSFIVSHPSPALAIMCTIAVLMWTIGVLLFIGLPKYYRQTPGAVPSFLRSILRRKIVLWFFYTVIIQNFFLSAPYGRNWLYLWSSKHVGGWLIAVMAIFFLLVVWAAILYAFHRLSDKHSWILPIAAIGLGAPRWCQMLWGTSGIGVYVPWAGSPIGSAFAGRALWLWLGVLDALQGVGFGMILLHTLTRFHISFTLVMAQILGSIATICARAFAPDKLGPGPIFPNLGLGISIGLGNAWFWICLACQLSICLLAFKFFRKEQLTKP